MTALGGGGRSRRSGGALLAALLLGAIVGLAAFGGARAQESAAAGMFNPSALPGDGGPLSLSLVAAYGPGVEPPAAGPTLVAKSLTTKHIDCQLDEAAGVAVEVPAGSITASGVGAAVAAAAAAEVAAAPPAAAKCVQWPLAGGIYGLTASFIPGAAWASWACYKQPVEASGSKANAAGALPAAEMWSSQSIHLEGGNAYTCIATYVKEAPAAVAAAAAISWDDAVATAADAGGAVATQACSGVGYTQPPRGKPPAPLRVNGNNLVNANNGQAVSIRGLNWFGFNVPMGMVDGLWAGGTDAATDFGKIAYQIAMLGYNAVRLPYTFNNLANTKVWDLVRQCTPLTNQQLKQRLVDPNQWSAYSNRALPNNPSVLANSAAGQCNTYLPVRKNEDRLLYALQAFVAQGMYVVLDYQPMGTEQHPYDLNQFVSGWAALWNKVTCLPNFNTDLAGRVFVDVMNEPDSMGIRWESQGGRPGAEQLYLATADALWKATPNKVLFMFEGTGQNSFGLNWGNGFVTDAGVISSRGLSDPNSFFKTLVGKPYAGASILTPHVYPPTITGNTFLGTTLWDQSRTAFGYLQSPGYCGTGSCRTFPVFVGETGSAYTSDTDKQWLNDFSDFAFSRGGAASYNAQPLDGWMWWAYNENSGDTGGIVKDSWQNLHWEKLRYMISKLNLKPWYLTAPVRASPPDSRTGGGQQQPPRAPSRPRRGGGSGSSRRGGSEEEAAATEQAAP